MTKLSTIASICALCLTSTACSEPPEPELPSPHDITEMTARLYNRPDSAPDLLDIVVPTGQYRRVLPLFEDRERDPAPAKWQVLGLVRIRVDLGGETCVHLFWTGKCAGAFRIGDVYYRGSTDAEIISVLVDCHGSGQPDAPSD